MGTHYKIGPLQLDPDAQVLTQEGAAVALGARAVAVLTVLVSRANEYVQKSAILDAAWPGLVVEEANLAVQISAIRRALARVRRRGLDRNVGAPRLPLRRAGCGNCRPVSGSGASRPQANQLAGVADLVHRTRAGTGRNQAAIARDPVTDADGDRGHRQDASGVAGSRRGARCLSGRDLVR